MLFASNFGLEWRCSFPIFSDVSSDQAPAVISVLRTFCNEMPARLAMVLLGIPCSWSRRAVCIVASILSVPRRYRFLYCPNCCTLIIQQSTKLSRKQKCLHLPSTIKFDGTVDEFRQELANRVLITLSLAFEHEFINFTEQTGISRAQYEILAAEYIAHAEDDGSKVCEMFKGDGSEKHKSKGWNSASPKNKRS